jgi:hypothetical protein
VAAKADALRLGHALGRVVAEVRNGARSARTYSGPDPADPLEVALTYADGWHAAATAAAIAAAEVAAELLAPDTAELRAMSAD